MARGQVTGRALVVGCPGDTLQGIDYDVGGMAEMLCNRGFQVDVRTGKRATRAGILEGYDAVIATVQRHEAAVVYYAGHGWYSVPEAESGKSWQGICPTDLHDSTTEDFRGITSWELAIKQKQLTERTRNVTMILDCCHAAQMSRDAAASAGVCRALPHPFRLGFAAHFAALRAQYGPAYDAVDANGNRDAVRLVACGQDESAFEYPVDGEFRGAFTEAVLDVLRAAGTTAVSWAALETAIRERVHRRFLIQRPVIEGPANRRPFSLEVATLGEIATVKARPDGLRIEAGELVGVTAGDIYAVMPPDSLEYRADSAIARLQVTQTCATSSMAVLCSEGADPATWPLGAVAIPVERHPTRFPVRIEPPDAAASIEAALAATGRLRRAGPSDATVLATVKLADGRLTIEDSLGPLFPGLPFPEGLDASVMKLANLGAAQALRERAGAHGVLASELEIEWGTVAGQTPERRPEAGASLALSDRIYVKVTSKTSRDLYVHILNIGIAGRIALLTGNSAPGGQLLTSDAPEFVYGREFGGTLRGERLGWPADVPRATYPRIDELIVIATAKTTSLRGLETPRQHGTARSAESGQQGVLPNVQDGLPRGVVTTATEDGYYLKRLSYLLHPWETVMSDTSFVLDYPLRQVALRSADAWVAPQEDSTSRTAVDATLVIEISDFTVPHDLATCDVRLDVLLCTRSNGTSRGYSTWTRTCRVADGDRLDLANAVVFDDAGHDFVEICLWVSPRPRSSVALADLLDQRGDRTVLADAARALSLRDAGATPWIAATGATSVLARAVSEVLFREIGQPIGLYRGALLASDRYRDRNTGEQHVLGYSFTLRIAAKGGTSA